jgi:hypothetical protein
MITLLALLLAGADARFEASGVRFGDVLVTGDVLELRAGALVSGRVLESLAAPLRVEAGDGLTLVLEPGVRASREARGVRLSTHGAARLKVAAGADAWSEVETLAVERTEAGWAVEGKPVAGDVRVSVLRQDDPDALLRRGESAASKMRQSSQRVRPPLQRRVFPGGNPFVASQPADSYAVRALAELSLSGN